MLGVGGVDAAAPQLGEFTFIEVRNITGLPSDADPSEVLWVVNADGSGLRRLTDPYPCEDCGQFPRFSPDGTLIAFVGLQNGGGIYTVGVDGHHLRSVASTCCESFPTFSGDGRRIAAGGFRIVVADYPSGKQARAVPNAKHIIYGLDWSRDGKEFAYSDSSLHVIRSDGSGAMTLSRFGFSPRFSPDGRTIAFMGRDGIYVIPSGGGVPKLVASGLSVAWSSDGQRIAIMGLAGGPTITIVDLRTGRKEHIHLPRKICPGSSTHSCQDLDWHT
jgi:Tol biopolymer transport system component